MVEKQTWIENGLVYCPGTANYDVMMKKTATILKILLKYVLIYSNKQGSTFCMIMLVSFYFQISMHAEIALLWASLYKKTHYLLHLV